MPPKVNKKKLKNFIDRPIESTFIEHYLSYFSDKPVKVITSSDLVNYNLTSLFDDKKRVFSVIFLEWPGQDIGHFVTLLHTSENTLEYYDPLCRNPHPDILQFVKNNRCTLDFIKENSIRIQADSANTCSRHAILRCQMSSLPIGEYITFITGHKNLNPDELVSSIVRFIE